MVYPTQIPNDEDQRDQRCIHSSSPAAIKDYPEVEQQSWVEQNREAQAYLAWYEDQQGAAPATPVLDNILLGHHGEDGEETLKELCDAMIGNADIFTQFQPAHGAAAAVV